MTVRRPTGCASCRLGDAGCGWLPTCCPQVTPDNIQLELHALIASADLCGVCGSVHVQCGLGVRQLQVWGHWM